MLIVSSPGPLHSSNLVEEELLLWEGPGDGDSMLLHIHNEESDALDLKLVANEFVSQNTSCQPKIKNKKSYFYYNYY